MAVAIVFVRDVTIGCVPALVRDAAFYVYGKGGGRVTGSSDDGLKNRRRCERGVCRREDVGVP